MTYLLKMDSQTRRDHPFSVHGGWALVPVISQFHGPESDLHAAVYQLSIKTTLAGWFTPKLRYIGSWMIPTRTLADGTFVTDYVEARYHVWPCERYPLGFL